MFGILHGVISFVAFIVFWGLGLMEFIIIAYAILSWLISFNVVNLRNRGVYQVSRVLENLARPILRPVQRILPSLGGLDFSPVIVLVLIEGVRNYLLPPFFAFLHALVGGPIIV